MFRMDSLHPAIFFKKQRCKFPGCNTWITQYSKKKSYKFPTEPNILKKWREICNIPITANSQHYYICEDHFSEQDFVYPAKNKQLLASSLPRHKELLLAALDHDYCKADVSSVETIVVEDKPSSNIASTSTHVTSSPTTKILTTQNPVVFLENGNDLLLKALTKSNIIQPDNKSGSKLTEEDPIEPPRKKSAVLQSIYIKNCNWPKPDPKITTDAGIEERTTISIKCSWRQVDTSSNISKREEAHLKSLQQKINKSQV